MNHPKRWWQRFRVDGWQDWTAIFRTRSHNWVDFTVFALKGEYDRFVSSVELHVGVLGFHVMLTYAWTPPLDAVEGTQP